MTLMSANPGVMAGVAPTEVMKTLNHTKKIQCFSSEHGAECSDSQLLNFKENRRSKLPVLTVIHGNEGAGQLS